MRAAQIKTVSAVWVGGNLSDTFANVDYEMVASGIYLGRTFVPYNNLRYILCALELPPEAAPEPTPQPKGKSDRKKK